MKSMFDILPVHTVVEGSTEYGTYRLMWRGYGRFTNLDTGTEWFVDSLPSPINIKIPAFEVQL